MLRVRSDGGLHWDLAMIEAGLDEGLGDARRLRPKGFGRLRWMGGRWIMCGSMRRGRPLADPFCYRDERTIKAERALHRKISPERLRELTGVQLIRINTLYQLFADRLQELAGGAAVAESAGVYFVAMGRGAGGRATNATHTQMVELYNRQWCREIFQAAQLDLACAPKIVPPGTEVGRLSGPAGRVAGAARCGADCAGVPRYGFGDCGDSGYGQ